MSLYFKVALTVLKKELMDFHAGQSQEDITEHYQKFGTLQDFCVILVLGDGYPASFIKLFKK